MYPFIDFDPKFVPELGLTHETVSMVMFRTEDSPGASGKVTGRGCEATFEIEATCPDNDNSDEGALCATIAFKPPGNEVRGLQGLCEELQEGLQEVDLIARIGIAEDAGEIRLSLTHQHDDARLRCASAYQTNQVAMASLARDAFRTYRAIRLFFEEAAAVPDHIETLVEAMRTARNMDMPATLRELRLAAAVLDERARHKSPIGNGEEN